MNTVDRIVLEQIQATIGRSKDQYAACAKLLLLRLYQRPEGFKMNGSHCGDVQLLVDLEIAVKVGGKLVLNKNHVDVARLTFIQ